ncbi:MAG: hypothetical protein Q9204_005449 [Flavoplaca sp. TL-2023a]
MDGSLLNKMKRKRRTSDDSRPTFNPVTPQAQHLSHVDIPSAMTTYSRTPETAWSNDRRNVLNGSPPAYEDQTDRTDWQHAHDTHRSTHDQNKVPQSDHPSEPLQATQVNPALARPSIAQLQETIERQLSLKVMLKHRELRLIDQEIGKCQVALEQLRRCHVIPYPAMSSSWEEMQAVASGIGRTQSNSAESAPPWVVTDGPYTRHYRHWLIPDTAFGDQVSEQLPVPQPSRTGLDRSVRASTAGKSSLVNQSRSQRGQGSARLKALPHGYPEAKEDKGPMIIKRLSDGKMVKLRCPVCARLNFNSVQGFINHCRIAHSRNFQSHEAAAIACGEEVELDQAGRIIGEPDTASAPTAGLVHPLITAKIPKFEPPTVVADYTSKTPATADTKKQLPYWSPAAAIASTETLPQTPVADNSASSASTSTPFHPSPLTPYLSHLVSKRGGGIDLEEEVNLAMTKYDVDADVLSDDDAEENDAGLEDAEVPRSSLGPVNHSTRGVVRPDHPPSRAVMAPVQFERSASVKPVKPESRRPKDLANLTSRLTHSAPMERLSPVSHTSGMMPLNHSGRLHDGAASPNLSPNTAESHQAPSLISDDDDFENTHSECSSTADVADDLERHYFGMNFESHDEHAMEDIDGASSSAGASHLGLGAELKGSHQPRRSSAMRSPDTIRNPIIDHNERHVTFASPMQRPRKKGGK